MFVLLGVAPHTTRPTGGGMLRLSAILTRSTGTDGGGAPGGGGGGGPLLELLAKD